MQMLKRDERRVLVLLGRRELHAPPRRTGSALRSEAEAVQLATADTAQLTFSHPRDFGLGVGTGHMGASGRASVRPAPCTRYECSLVLGAPSQ